MLSFCLYDMLSIYSLLKLVILYVDFDGDLSYPPFIHESLLYKKGKGYINSYHYKSDKGGNE